MAKDVAVRVETSHVEWGAVFAGAVAAAALSFVLLSATASLGLSLISAYPGQSYAKSGGMLAGFWSLIVVIGSFFLGGYIAGRLRASWREGGTDEVAFRDGIHGLLVWSVGILFGAVIAFVAALTAAHATARVTASAPGDAAVAPATDTLLRTSSTGANTAPLDRGDVVRVLTVSVANGQLSANDRSYLAQTVAQRAGIPAADAEKRVDNAFADAQRAVETARKASVATGLLTASALLIGLLAAWYGAQRGGYNRDHNIWGRAPAMMRERRPQAPLD